MMNVDILVVEDSAVEAEMLRRILIRAGYQVNVAKNGEEGLQALRERRCALVMSDINMPLMNGYELCLAIKLDETLWRTPVVLVTSLSDPKDIIKALDVGADGYVTKPYVEDILLGRIRSLLANPARRKIAEERRKIQVEYGGEQHNVAVGNPQMANLLLSVYENSLTLNQELMHIQNQLTVLNENLDEKVRERTASLMNSEQKLRDSLAEKEVMMREIHHRVKNNMQMMSALLELQAGYVKDEQVLGYFKDSQQRIQSMAMIHEQLYRNENMAQIDFAAYLHSLVGNLSAQFAGRSGQVKIQIDAEVCTLPVDTAIPCGLVVSELVSNVFKHAYPNETSGELRIRLRCGDEGRVVLEVADDGVGLPAGLDIHHSFGLRVVGLMVEKQLHGKLSINENHIKQGTRIVCEIGVAK